jgi:hypothetical protein
VGGPGNSLDRNYNYSTEKNINFIAEKTTNTNVGFVNLSYRHDVPWMNRKVRNINIWLDRVLMGRDMFHIGVIDVLSF